MMDLLLAWYLAVFIGCGASVYRSTREPVQRPPHVRVLPPWLSSLVAYTEPLDGYQDPIFLSDESKPMELEQDGRRTAEK